MRFASIRRSLMFVKSMAGSPSGATTSTLNAQDSLQGHANRYFPVVDT